MREFAHASAFPNGGADAREPREQLHVVKQRIAESLCSLRVIFGDVADDFSQILQRFVSEEESEIHLGKSSLTFSMETVRPGLGVAVPREGDLRGFR